MVVPLSATDEDILNTEIQVLISRKKNFSENPSKYFVFTKKKFQMVKAYNSLRGQKRGSIGPPRVKLLRSTSIASWCPDPPMDKNVK